MKTTNALKLFTLITGFSLFILFTGCTSDTLDTADEEVLTSHSLSAKSSGPSASGHGTISFENLPTLNGEGFRQFTFHARENNNGTVTGGGVITYQGGELNLKFDINCLSVEGNIAVMSGVITKFKDNPASEGQLFYFEVMDNGEGSKTDTDQISVFYRGTDPAVYTCAINYDNPLYFIEGGNIQVQE